MLSWTQAQMLAPGDLIYRVLRNRMGRTTSRQTLRVTAIHPYALDVAEVLPAGEVNSRYWRNEFPLTNHNLTGK